VGDRLKYWENQGLIKYSEAVKALTGLIFLVQAIIILNYGTKLETALS
jgi:hypothetical protein